MHLSLQTHSYYQNPYYAHTFCRNEELKSDLIRIYIFTYAYKYDLQLAQYRGDLQECLNFIVGVKVKSFLLRTFVKLWADFCNKYLPQFLTSLQSWS